jgi:hypothetical protein
MFLASKFLKIEHARGGLTFFNRFPLIFVPVRDLMSERQRSSALRTVEREKSAAMAVERGSGENEGEGEREISCRVYGKERL